jgi:uncharacterized protein YjbJ (UPF0337 family)
MSFLNKAKDAAQEAAAKAKEAAEKAKEFASDHTEQMKGAIDKAGGVADKATKGKFKTRIEKVGEKAGQAVDKLKKDEKEEKEGE